MRLSVAEVIVRRHASHLHHRYRYIAYKRKSDIGMQQRRQQYLMSYFSFCEKYKEQTYVRKNSEFH